MDKNKISTGITVFPMPAGVISVGSGDNANLITLGYVGKVCMEPPIIAISMRKSRHSYKLIEGLGEFVLNYPSKDQLYIMDYCGNHSGKDIDKWEKLSLTKEKGAAVKVPLIKEFPWNMECKVVNRLELGSHVCYFGEVVAVHSDSKYISNGKLDPLKLDTFIYTNGHYLGVERQSLGKYGFSLKKS